MGKMSLENVVSGVQKSCHRVIVYGPEGTGKSTFGAGAPNPIFLDVEKSTQQLDVARFPHPENWMECVEAVDHLLESTVKYETFVVDTIDVLEKFLWRHLCETEGKKSMSAFAYGQGYEKARDEMRALTRKFDTLIEKGLHVILLGHSHNKMFKDPQGYDHDRYELSLHKSVGAELRAWCDALGFANHETIINEDPTTGRVKVKDTGKRGLYFERDRGFDAKNRYRLPKKLPLQWADFAKHADSVASEEKSVLAEEIKALLPQLPEDKKDVRTKVEAIVASGDVDKMGKALTRLKEMVA